MQKGQYIKENDIKKIKPRIFVLFVFDDEECKTIEIALLIEEGMKTA